MSTTAPSVNGPLVNQPLSRLARSVRHCPTCKCRRRYIEQVFGYHAPILTCGGCGYTFYPDTGGRSRKELCERNKQIVKKQWPTLGTVREALEFVLKNT